MPEFWIILYRGVEGILTLDGAGNLADWPLLPDRSEVLYVGIPFADLFVHCYYSIKLSESEAVFCTRIAHADGTFRL